MPISITLCKEWFDTVAEGDPGNIVLFKINETTCELEGDITMTPESITITDNRVTFRATFDHFSVFALVARPPAAIHPDEDGRGDGGGGGTPAHVPHVSPTIIMPTPTPALGETAVIAAETPTPRAAAAWVPLVEKLEQEERLYLARIILLAIAAGIIIFILRRSLKKRDD